MIFKPSVMVLMVCALGCTGNLHAIPPVPGLDAARAVSRALEKEPEERPASASAYVQLIARAAGS